MTSQAQTLAHDEAPAASRSSFYAAMRMLPQEQRDAMYHVYAFCRAVDDVADNGGAREPRLAELARYRADLDEFYASGRTTLRTSYLANAITKFGLKKDDFIAVVDGMEMDIVRDIQAPDWATLDLYCDRAASAVGRLSVPIFGIEGELGVDLAHHLGRALQLTNILRDIDEDAALGRLYLPKEALIEGGITETDIDVLEDAARRLFFGREKPFSVILAEIASTSDLNPYVKLLIDFLHRRNEGRHGRYLESQRTKA